MMLVATSYTFFIYFGDKITKKNPNVAGYSDFFRKFAPDMNLKQH